MNPTSKAILFGDVPKISTNTLEKLVKASYKKNKGAKRIGNNNGYTLDKKLSNREAKVFVSKSNNTPTVVYTGSRKGSDWITNAQLAVGLLDNTQRLKRSKDLMQDVRDKYKNKHVTALGHSLGGSLAEATNADRKITINKGTGLFGIGKKIDSNQTDIRTGSDPVSLLSRFQTGGTKITIPKTNYLNPLKAHSYTDVSKLKINL